MRKSLCFCGLAAIMALLAVPALAQPGASSGESEPVDSEAVSPPYAEDSDVPDTAEPTPGTDAAKAAEEMTAPPASIEPGATENSAAGDNGDEPADAEPPVAPPTTEGTGSAEPPPAEPAEPPAVQAVEDEPAATGQPFLPNSPDTLAGHLRLSLGFVGTLPFGNLQSPTKDDDIQVGFNANFGNGIGIDGEFSVGVSRHVDIGAYGQYLWMGGNSIDTDADPPQVQESLVQKGFSPNIFAAGAFVGYHLVQGTQFDPWISYGLGYRKTSNANVAFSGMDFIRLRVGGDWYAAPAFGFGPYVGMDMGLFWKRSKQTIQSKSLHFMAFFGFRAVFDYPGH